MTLTAQQIADASYLNTDDAEPTIVLAAVESCAMRWAPDARIIGNVRACDIVRALAHLRSLPKPALTEKELRYVEGIREFVQLYPKHATAQRKLLAIIDRLQSQAPGERWRPRELFSDNQERAEARRCADHNLPCPNCGTLDWYRAVCTGCDWPMVHTPPSTGGEQS